MHDACFQLRDVGWDERVCRDGGSAAAVVGCAAGPQDARALADSADPDRDRLLLEHLPTVRLPGAADP